MLDKETIIDNIEGAIECIKALGEELNNTSNISIQSLINGNVILLKQTQSYLREELK